MRTAAAEERNDLEHFEGKDYEADAYESKRATFETIMLTWRLIKAFTLATLLDELTYKRIMKNLRRAKKARVGDEDWQLIR